MKQEHADAIIATLDRGWWQETSGDSQHWWQGDDSGSCLGMAITDSLARLGQADLIPEAMDEVGQQIKRLFPERTPPRKRLGLLMFQCCNSQIVPFFNDDPRTSLEDVKLAVKSAVSA